MRKTNSDLVKVYLLIIIIIGIIGLINELFFGNIIKPQPIRNILQILDFLFLIFNIYILVYFIKEKYRIKYIILPLLLIVIFILIIIVTTIIFFNAHGNLEFIKEKLYPFTILGILVNLFQVLYPLIFLRQNIIRDRKKQIKEEKN